MSSSCHFDTCKPYPEQESEELRDEVVARLNPKTGEVENMGEITVKGFQRAVAVYEVKPSRAGVAAASG